MNTDHPPMTDWLTNWTVEVTSPSAQLYPNALQQVEVSVRLYPRRDQDVSETELASVRLVAEEDDGSYLELPMKDNGGDWFGSDRRNNYDYHPDRSSSPAAIETDVRDEDAIKTRRFYLHSRARAGVRQTFRAKVTHIIGAQSYEYISNGEHYSAKASVDVISAAPPPYTSPEDYRFERRLVGGNGNSDLFVWEYELAAVHPVYGPVKFLQASAASDGMVQWALRSDNETRAGHVGFAGPGETAFRYNHNIALGPAFRPVPHVSAVRPNAVVVVLQGGNNIPYDRDSFLYHSGPITLYPIDCYGNHHEVRVKFKDGTPIGRTELVLL